MMFYLETEAGMTRHPEEIYRDGSQKDWSIGFTGVQQNGLWDDSWEVHNVDYPEVCESSVGSRNFETEKHAQCEREGSSVD